MTGRRVGRTGLRDTMPITITGRHMAVTPALKRYLQQRIQRLTRYGVKLDSGQFVLSIEKYRHAVEGVVVVSGRLVQGKVSTREMYASIDCLLEKLERQLLKNKEKLVARRLRGRSEPGVRGKAALPVSEGKLEVTRAPVLLLEEALRQLGAHGSPMLVFQNATAGRLQVLRRADDNRIELIDIGSPASAE